MLIKKLIIAKTYPEYDIIRDIKFNENGLNLIIDNTTNSKKDSGNNVGKTTFIKIIDLCLGAKSVSTLYYDSDTKSNNDEIKEFLNKNKIEAELELIDEYSKITYSFKRQLYNNGKRFIDSNEYSKEEFLHEIKKIIFNSSENYPTLRELMPKFIRIQNNNTDNIIKFLGNFSKNHQYDTIYQFLFNILDDKLINEKSNLNTNKSNCIQKIKLLENDKNIKSLDLLKQKANIIENDLIKLIDERKKLNYIQTYKNELDIKRKISIQIDVYEQRLQMLDFDLELLSNSIESLKSDKANIDIKRIKAIYEETKKNTDDLQKKFEDVVTFHNIMIENRISFLAKQKKEKEKEKEEITNKRDTLLEEKKNLTVELLDEGLLTELNVLNNKIEKLSLEKGEILQSIKIIEENEKELFDITKKIENISNELNSDNINEKIVLFNKYFSEYSEIVYGEKYLFAYNSNWEGQKEFPVAISNFNGTVGTGMKKGMIAVFDLAYLKYANEIKMHCPKFIIHDKLETTHINQLKTIFKICEKINGQFIIPILKERIKEIGEEEIKKYTILELSQKEKLFKI